ncbi:hypothetical protein AN5590.2 [Aspergillus nidulans FGSC A4]|uniref:Defect at low temperature protein 1 n=1 Tax=Emericella nidulans (strain FGSC A4 / ATCC 38163 / CBS 112.46 / NRRL 194 / M139) TaxID=227321 RepID=Q5B1J0_EMENI|nr:hypothetical protein [Aspergillus nidulans FGSC A4]EAA62233.1 hypothetical protein AN5590.2 [Aspergillus nidulans FGSC A4]CBF81605.1 TPA: thermatolerance membrane protein Dlt1, putative (AFU_orthologue; AFUA_4G11467) [Aspergillus nidulans FGSC A4]|eukprot:XP_663194.1 hypothetical protein AN5590.2 [Aspergillus nidulans FGSC A4]
MLPSRPTALPNSNLATRIRNGTTITRLLNYTVFTLLSIILLCLILLTPADAIYQCYVTHRLTNIFIITGGYVVTFLLAVLIYATRIYTNRSVLGGIPKAWIPVEKEDVSKSVRRLVVEGLGRSALIARGARPRNLGRGSGANGPRDVDGNGQAFADPGAGDNEEKEGLLRGFDYDVDPSNPPWGVIEHPGWSAPESSLSASAPDQGTSDGDAQTPEPSLCYRTVIRELPHLIEAKAVSLAPPDPVFTVHPQYQTQTGEGDEATRIPDTRIVAILRRPGTMSLRSYINHLISLSILHPPEIGLEFLALYERARFSGKELYEDEFRELMGVFADVLRGMRFDQEHHRLLLDMNDYNEDGDLGHWRRNTSVFEHSLFGSKTESVIGPSDEEGETTETDTLGSVNINIDSPRRRHRRQRQSRSGPRSRPVHGNDHTYNHTDGHPNLEPASRPPPGQSRSRSQSLVDFKAGNLSENAIYWPRAGARTPSTHSARSLHPDRSYGSGSGADAGSGLSLRSASRSGSASGSASVSLSGGSVIRLADARTESVSGLPYVIGR